MPLGAERIGGGERPEAVERGVEIAPQLEGVEAVIERLKLLAFRRGEHAGGAEALVRRLGPVVDAVDPRAVPRLRHELFHGLEEVHVQAGEAIDAGELSIGSLGSEAIIADELADDGAVFLLHVRAVVLLPGAAAGERDPLALTPRVELVVDELRAVVAVEPDERHREARADVMDRRAHALLPLAPEGFELDPRRGNIHGAEGAEGEALRTGSHSAPP